METCDRVLYWASFWQSCLQMECLSASILMVVEGLCVMSGAVSLQLLSWPKLNILNTECDTNSIDVDCLKMFIKFLFSHITHLFIQFCCSTWTHLLPLCFDTVLLLVGHQERNSIPLVSKYFLERSLVDHQLTKGMLEDGQENSCVCMCVCVYVCMYVCISFTEYSYTERCVKCSE